MAQGEYPPHPAASIFPMMEGDELQELAEDIEKHGLAEPIKLHDDQIIDGRNRLRACLQVGVKPRYETAAVNGSPADYVFSANYHRRHLTEGAKQMAAGRYKKERAREDAAKRKKEAGKKYGRGRPKDKVAAKTPQPKREPESREVAGQKFGVGGKTVDSAEKILGAAPEVVRAVERGDIKVSTAARLAEIPKKTQREAIKGGKAAVRKAIEKHVPSPTEEARNDPGVRFHKSMQEILKRVITTRESGGIKGLCRMWTPEQRDQYAQDIEEFVEEFEKWLKVLRGK